MFFPTSLCGVLVFDSVSRVLPASSRLPPPPLHTHLSHTIFVNHHLSHTIFHTPSLTHHLSHTSLSTTSFHTPSFTHHLLHTPSFMSTIFVNHHLSHTIFYTPSFVFHLAWHLATYTFVLRGGRGTSGVGLALVARLGRFWSPVTPRHFAWQAWHLVTSTCVAGVALGHIHLRFAWQAWHLWHWAGSSGALGPVLVAGDAAALCVAGVALGDIHLRFAWQAWHLVTSTFVLLAGVALVALGCLRWRAWAGFGRQ